MRRIHYHKVGESKTVHSNIWTSRGIVLNGFFVILVISFIVLEYHYYWLRDALNSDEDENIPTYFINGTWLNESTSSILAENPFPIDNPYDRNNSVLDVYQTASFPQVYADSILHAVHDVYGYFGRPGPTQLFMISGDEYNEHRPNLNHLETIYCLNTTSVITDYNHCLAHINFYDIIMHGGSPYVERITQPKVVFTFMMPLTYASQTYNEATLTSYFGRVAIHEAIHIIQFAYGNFQFTYPSGPRWWSEGMADFCEEYISYKRPSVQYGWSHTKEQSIQSFKTRRNNYAGFVDANGVTIREAETNAEYYTMDSLSAYRLLYEGGSLAFLYCFVRASEQSLATIRSFFQTNYEHDWETAFFNLCNTTSVTTFYNEFDTIVHQQTEYNELIESVFT